MYFANNLFLFEAGKFNYMQLSDEELAAMLGDHAFLLISFNADVTIMKLARGVVEINSIEELTRILGEAVEKYVMLDILVSDCYAAQTINGSKAKKGAAFRFLKDTLTSKLEKSKIAVSFVSELEDTIAQRYFSPKTKED